MTLAVNTKVKLRAADRCDKLDGLEVGEEGTVILHPYDADDAGEELSYVDFSGLRKWMEDSQLEVIA